MLPELTAGYDYFSFGIRGFGLKRVAFHYSTKSDLAEAPDQIKLSMGGALRTAQQGGKADDSSPMRGELRDVMEISDEDDSGTYRTMYTVAIGDTVHVLDFFKKKATSGISTPKVDLDRILRRLKKVREEHANEPKR